MYVRVAKRVRARDQISMNRNMVGIPYLGARNPHCPEYPLIYEILVGIPSSGDSGQWGFRPVGIPGGNLWTSIITKRGTVQCLTGALAKIATPGPFRP